MWKDSQNLVKERKDDYFKDLCRFFSHEARQNTLGGVLLSHWCILRKYVMKTMMAYLCHLHAREIMSTCLRSMLLIFLLRHCQKLFLIIWGQDWFLTLTIHIFDNQLTHFNIKTWKVLCWMQVFKGTIFCCVRSCRRKCYNNCYFSYQMFLLIEYFSSGRDPRVVKIVSNILRSLFHKKNLVKITSSDKRQRQTWCTFSICLVIIDAKLTVKDLYLSIFLKIWTLNLLFSYIKYKFNTFRWYKYHFIG